MASGKIDWGIVGFVFSIVALVLSVPLGIASHLLAHRFLAYLEKRKLIKSNRSKEQEIANYKRVEAFKNGTMDRYPYCILLATAAVISAVGSATCLVLVILEYWNGFDLPDFPLLLTLLLTFPFGVFAAVFMVVIAETAKHIEQFEQYQAEIRKKWGDDVI